MESMRDIKRAMEKEIEKGSCPLSFERLMFGEEPFRFIRTEEKLREVLAYLLRTGDYGQYASKTVGNNVYMDLDILCRKAQFRRTRSALERHDVYKRVLRYKNRLKPDYENKVCLETVRCVFHLPEDTAAAYRMVYNGQETYGFIMSDRYILGLFTLCEAARKEIPPYGKEEHREIAMLSGVRDVLFQSLLLDNILKEGNDFYADMCTVMLLK